MLEYKRYIFLCKKNKIFPSVDGFKKSLRLAWDIYTSTKATDAQLNYWSVVRYFI